MVSRAVVKQTSMSSWLMPENTSKSLPLDAEVAESLAMPMSITCFRFIFLGGHTFHQARPGLCRLSARLHVCGTVSERSLCLVKDQPKWLVSLGLLHKTHPEGKPEVQPMEGSRTRASGGSQRPRGPFRARYVAGLPDMATAVAWTCFRGPCASRPKQRRFSGLKGYVSLGGPF